VLEEAGKTLPEIPKNIAVTALSFTEIPDPGVDLLAGCDMRQEIGSFNRLAGRKPWP
jgi:hypothetical protein